MHQDLTSLLSLAGERVGRLKELAGYRKPAGLGSSGFQSPSLGAEEVAAVGEELFASVRSAMGYKRKDIRFSQEGTAGMLICRDFDLALELALPPDDKDSYVLRKTLSNLKSESLFENPAFSELFANTFQRLEMRSANPLRVEDWIDRVEDRDLEEEWRLEYPPDYAHCSLRLPGSEFEIKITPEKLVMVRLLPAPPSEFWEGFKKLAPVLQPA